MATEPRAGRSRVRVPIFLVSETSRPSVGFSELSFKWTMISFLGGRAVGGVKLNTHLSLAVKVKNEWSHTSTSLLPSWRGNGHVYHLFTVRLAGGEHL